MYFLFTEIAEVYYEYYNEDDLLVDEDYLKKGENAVFRSFYSLLLFLFRFYANLVYLL